MQVGIYVMFISTLEVVPLAQVKYFTRELYYEHADSELHRLHHSYQVYSKGGLFESRANIFVSILPLLKSCSSLINRAD